MITTGIDVGSAAVKAVLVRTAADASAPEVMGRRLERLRRRDPRVVVDETHAALLDDHGLTLDDVDYVASTGEGDWIEFATGHFYGMTTHARGAVFLEPEARGALDVGGLHARAILMDEHSKVLGYRMTSQCASGSGQFLENIARYLGIALSEVGELSLESKEPEKPSGICAVLAETDVINMVSRGIEKSDILRGIHLSMGERYAKLLRASKVRGVALMTGGLAADVGLLDAIRTELARQEVDLDLRAHPQSVQAGALGAALWGAFRYMKLRERGTAA